MIDVFGTLGPSCENIDVLEQMFSEGMTGIRINLSHVMLKDYSGKIETVRKAAGKTGIIPKILIDMQGPEIRIGNLKSPITLRENDIFSIGQDSVPVPEIVLEALKPGQTILLDDGKISAEVVTVTEKFAKLRVVCGGILNSRKSLAVSDAVINMPALTDSDEENLKIARECGVTGVMQPFVRSSDDLKELRKVLDSSHGHEIKIYAKIENKAGVENLTTFFDHADEIVIARGDLGNFMPLWELPKVQKTISRICNEHKVPFMVVTQMLASMEHSKVPTRAEVSDIYNAVLDGAHSVMVTGETAVGENPVEVIKYLSRTAKMKE